MFRHLKMKDVVEQVDLDSQLLYSVHTLVITEIENKPRAY